jgi:hypothetical protein
MLKTLESSELSKDILRQHRFDNTSKEIEETRINISSLTPFSLYVVVVCIASRNKTAP